MALVAYANSDSSEFEDDEDANENATATAALSNPSIASATEPSDPIHGHKESTTNLFNLLPQPSRTKPEPVEEEDDEFLHKREMVTNVVKPKAKITVPSLDDFKDVEDSAVNKPRQPSGKKSGLLSMLPQPRNGVISTTTSKSLIPNILKQPKPQEIKKPLPSPVPKVKETKQLALDYSDDSDNEDVQNDFFSINQTEEPLPEINAEVDSSVLEVVKSKAPNQKLPSGIESFFKSPERVDMEPESAEDDDQVPSYSSYAPEEQSSSDLPLDDEAIRALCGARGARGARGRREEIRVVDVDQREVLAEARQMLAKGLLEDTSQRASASKRRGLEPSAQQRKKHQITYLAHQAKANEAELQNQWANSRMSRKQTQSKYGF